MLEKFERETKPELPTLIELESGTKLYETPPKKLAWTGPYPVKTPYDPSSDMKRLIDDVCELQTFTWLGPSIFMFSPRGKLCPVLTSAEGWVSSCIPLDMHDGKPPTEMSISYEIREMLPPK